eukprot:CAMPEP_0173421042 /NCGR_PEP_ID=MMETSP1357-20121228/2293_1 /TAXON_ID=77926 /ORGANISM="Hemiselmis rufescens, Strain PCC563" /LENGTH=114 /DNA_ID=CAMNT_0014383907 /DNA_START=106 /DNA_END=447 /DNA_ORIENTATION=+
MPPPAGIAAWTVQDVCEWLDRACRGKFGDAKTDHYKALVMEHDVDGETLADAGSDELSALGITSFGHRHFLIKQLQSLRAAEQGQQGYPGGVGMGDPSTVQGAYGTHQFRVPAG